MNDERLHTRVGIGVLALLGALVAGVFLLEGKHLRPGIRVHVEVGRLGPIQAGTPVRVAGKRIGEIEAVRLVSAGPADAAADPLEPRARVVLDVWIARRHAWMVRTSSEFFVNQQYIFGEAYLEVGPARGGEPGPRIADGATVRGIDPPRLDQLAQVGYENLKAATDLFRTGLPELRDLGAAWDELERALDAVEPAPGAAAGAWAAGARLVGESRAFADALGQAGVSVADLRRTSARARALFAHARRELAALRARLAPLIERVDLLRARLTPKKFARFALALAEVDRVVARAEAVVADAEAIAALVDRGEGTIGAFLHDEEIADDFKQTLRLMKQQPWVTIGHP